MRLYIVWWSLMKKTLRQRSPTFLAPGTGFVEDWTGVGDGSGSNASNCAGGNAHERWGAAGEASLAHPPLTSCCAVRQIQDLQPNLGLQVWSWMVFISLLTLPKPQSDYPLQAPYSPLPFIFFKSLLNLLQYCFCFMFWVFVFFLAARSVGP